MGKKRSDKVVGLYFALCSYVGERKSPRRTLSSGTRTSVPFRRRRQRPTAALSSPRLFEYRSPVRRRRTPPVRCCSCTRRSFAVFFSTVLLLIVFFVRCVQRRFLGVSVLVACVYSSLPMAHITFGGDDDDN